LAHVSGLSTQCRGGILTINLTNVLLSHDLSYKPNNSAMDIIRNLRNLRPSHDMVGAQVVTALSGVPFTDFVKSRILKPLQ
jgi:hypothetical protein